MEKKLVIDRPSYKAVFQMDPRERQRDRERDLCCYLKLHSYRKSINGNTIEMTHVKRYKIAPILNKPYFWSFV